MIMNKLKKIADIFRRERAAQDEKKNVFCQKALAEGITIKTEKPILSVKEFLEAVNPKIAKEGIKPLNKSDIKTAHLFSYDGRLERTCFTTTMGCCIIFAGVNETVISLTTERERFLPTDHFRIYLDENHFALCYLCKGNIMASSIFYEYQDSRGDYVTRAVLGFPKNTLFREIDL